MSLERGFEQTTAADIAQRAGVNPRTCFRHFPDKREVLLAGEADLRTALTQYVSEAPDGLTPAEVLLQAFGRAAHILEENRSFAEPRLALSAATPTLRERDLAKGAAMALAVAEAPRRRGVDGRLADLAAHTAWAAFHHAAQNWIDDPGPRPPAHLTAVAPRLCGTAEAGLVGDDHELGAVAGIPFGHGVVDVRLDGERAEGEAVGDFGVPQLFAVSGDGYGFGAGLTDIGRYLLPAAAMAALSGPLGGLGTRRLGSTAVVAAGIVLMTAALIGMAFVHTEVWHLVVGKALISLANGACITALVIRTATAVDEGTTGTATSLVLVIRVLGFATGAQVGGAALTAGTPGGSDVPAESAYVTALVVASVVTALSLLAIRTMSRGAGE
ncbi:hypothetical protein Ate01nite_63100 [Actinoplanes teichomyceticus]|nr:hypothetical protein Ate01nite_63100 [Actinoplanes teichomyceticus]